MKNRLKLRKLKIDDIAAIVLGLYATIIVGMIISIFLGTLIEEGIWNFMLLIIGLFVFCIWSFYIGRIIIRYIDKRLNRFDEKDVSIITKPKCKVICMSYPVQSFASSCITCVRNSKLEDNFISREPVIPIIKD